MCLAALVAVGCAAKGGEQAAVMPGAKAEKPIGLALRLESNGGVNDGSRRVSDDDFRRIFQRTAEGKRPLQLQLGVADPGECSMETIVAVVRRLEGLMPPAAREKVQLEITTPWGPEVVRFSVLE
jgi:hypothetical protein